MSQTTTDTLLTAEDFWNLPDDDTRRELVDGEVLETMPPNYAHGKLSVRFAVAITIWTQQSGDAGEVGVESGFILARNPDTVRGPDVFYLAADKVPAARATERGFVPFAPDLAVEVVSPDDRPQAIARKVADYLNGGTRLVWVVYPRQQTVLAHTPDRQVQTFGPADTLTAPEVLPGFACPLATLFT